MKVHFIQKKLTTTALSLLTLLLLTSCAGYYYAPNSQNVPLFKEKGEHQFKLALSSGYLSDGYEIQTAHAIGNHTALMLNMHWHGASDEIDQTSGYLYEAGAGYFSNLTPKIIMETYGGIGFGNISNDLNYGESEVRFNRIFIQPNIGFSSKHFDFALSSRFCGLRYSYIYSDFSEQHYIDDITLLKENPFSILWEPAATIRTGWEKVQFKIQYGLSFNVNNPHQMFLMDEQNFNIGIQFNINPENKKNTEP